MIYILAPLSHKVQGGRMYALNVHKIRKHGEHNMVMIFSCLFTFIFGWFQLFLFIYPTSQLKSAICLLILLDFLFLQLHQMFDWFQLFVYFFQIILLLLLQGHFLITLSMICQLISAVCLLFNFLNWFQSLFRVRA